MSELLVADDLHVAYGRVEAVRGVSLAMQAGQIVTVIGPFSTSRSIETSILVNGPGYPSG